MAKYIRNYNIDMVGMVDNSSMMGNNSDDAFCQKFERLHRKELKT